MQTITPALEAILKAKFQAAASGFRGRVFEMVESSGDIACPAVAGDIVSSFFTSDEQTTSAPPGTFQPPDPPFFPALMFVVGGYRQAGTSIGWDIEITEPSWTEVQMESAYVGAYVHDLFVAGYQKFEVGDTVPIWEVDWTVGGAPADFWAALGVSVPTDATDVIQYSDDSTTSGGGAHFANPVVAGNAIIHLVGGSNAGGGSPDDGSAYGWTLIDYTTYGGGIGTAFLAAYYRCITQEEQDAGTTSFHSMAQGAAAWAASFEVNASQTGIGLVELPPVKRISIDKSLRLTADQAEVEFTNEALALGWGPSSVFRTNQRIAIDQWYGDSENAVRSFMGVVDDVIDHRDVLTTTIKCRDMMAILIDETFSTIGPQAADETGAIRTEANGVFLNREVSYIVGAFLDAVGWPTDDRDITPTSYVLDEFIITDGQSYADAMIGDEQLTGLVGYSAWADEVGVFHFAPTLISQNLSDPDAPVYTFRSGEDILALDDETDQYDLRTRVKVRGPLTTTTLSDTWTEVWRTSKIKHPVGIWWDPGDPGNIRVIDRETKRLYKMRQSDRAILSSAYLGSAIGHPLGLSGDPSNSSIYWVLNAPWIHGISGGNQVVKVRKSDNHVLARYSIPSGRWSAIKVSAANIWLTNLDTDRFYKRSKTDASAVANYSHTYNAVVQANPSGLMVDGTKLFLFWANGGTTARFLVCDESAPTVITKVVKTVGTVLHGGEMDTVTHRYCWGDSDSLGLVAKFQLLEAVDQTTEASAEVVCIEMEDELGQLALLNRREHDAHPDVPDHRWEARRMTLNLDVITSIVQATETAQRQLDIACQRRRVLDAGIVGNPALQKTDYVAVVDVRTGIEDGFAIDTYRTTMDAEGTYLGTVALLPVEPIDDVPTDEGDSTGEVDIATLDRTAVATAPTVS